MWRLCVCVVTNNGLGGVATDATARRPRRVSGRITPVPGRGCSDHARCRSSGCIRAPSLPGCRRLGQSSSLRALSLGAGGGDAAGSGARATCSSGGAGGCCVRQRLDTRAVYHSNGGGRQQSAARGLSALLFQVLPVVPESL